MNYAGIHEFKFHVKENCQLVQVKFIFVSKCDNLKLDPNVNTHYLTISSLFLLWSSFNSIFWGISLCPLNFSRAYFVFNTIFEVTLSEFSNFHNYFFNFFSFSLDTTGDGSGSKPFFLYVGFIIELTVGLGIDNLFEIWVALLPASENFMIIFFIYSDTFVYYIKLNY